MIFKKYAVIVAGGSGTRMNSTIPKQFMVIKEKPLIYYTVKTFLESFGDICVIVLFPKDYLEKAENIFTGLDMDRIIVAQGGNTRFESVKNGLKHISNDCVIFVHDGVRCMVTIDLIKKCFHSALQYGSAIPVVQVTDSIRIVENKHNESIDRENVYIVQTPQTFQSNILLKAFEKEYNPIFTDEASVVEADGIKMHLVEGDYQNIKVTRPIDLIIVESLMQL